MKEWIIDILLGMLIFIIGFLLGFVYSNKAPTKEMLSEIKALQHDIVRVETQGMKNFIKIEDLDKWRDSIMFRPPELPKKKGE